jgi:hypothetical protein
VIEACMQHDVCRYSCKRKEVYKEQKWFGEWITVSNPSDCTMRISGGFDANAFVDAIMNAPEPVEVKKKVEQNELF